MVAGPRPAHGIFISLEQTAASLACFGQRYDKPNTDSRSPGVSWPDPLTLISTSHHQRQPACLPSVPPSPSLPSLPMIPSFASSCIHSITNKFTFKLIKFATHVQFAIHSLSLISTFGHSTTQSLTHAPVHSFTHSYSYIQ